MVSNKSKKKTAPAPETITVKVDGQAVDMPRTMPDPLTGEPVPTTMIQACKIAGVEIPHYCYHPKLPVAGNCRMCLVEYGMPALGPDRQPLLNEDGAPEIRRMTLPYEPGTPRGAIACATPVAPGMEIYANSPATRQMREAVLESLLINHPLDCPICDQAGECKLQEYSVEHGQAASRFVEQKVHKPKQVDLGPRIMLDAERCILCSRCIRFTKDIAGDDALGFVDRGSYSTLTTFPGKPFDNNYTLNTADICPVGALTSKDFRFQMRVWFLKESPSLCTSCGTGCNVVMGSREEQIYRYEPRENDAVNSSWLCDEGRLNYRWIGRPDRLADPLRDGQKTGDWPALLQAVAERLADAKPGSTAVIASARQTTEELFLLRRLAQRLDALSDTPARLGEADQLLVSADKNPNTNGARLSGFCFTEMGINLPKIASGIRRGKITNLIVFGEDVTRCGIDRALLQKVECLIVSDILPNETTARAHFLLPGCAHAEKRGTFVNVKGRLQRFFKAVEPPGRARPETEFLTDLVHRLTGESLPDNPEGLFNHMASEIKAFSKIRWSDLGDTGVDVPV